MNQNTKFIPFALPSIGKEEEDAVIKVLRSNWLTTGEKTREFEIEFAKKLNAKTALAVNSATAGLHLALEALNISNDDYVITSPYTFTATAEICRYLGAHPLFADINKETYNINPDEVEKLILKNNKRIKAIIPVHIAGLPCEMDRLMEISKKYDIPIIEDASHAFPVKYKDKWLGSIGKAGVFSFYATKPITTGEGGMIVCNDESFAERISLMRLHGIDREMWDRYTSKTSKWEYDVVEAGFKYNLTDMASAIGLEQLKKTFKLKEKRTEIAKIYLDKFSQYDFLALPTEAEDHAWHLFILRLIPEKLKISRDEFVNRLIDKGIGISVHYKPLHIMSFYKNTYGYKSEDYPISINNYENSFSLPIYSTLTDEQIQKIHETVIETALEYYKN